MDSGDVVFIEGLLYYIAIQVGNKDGLKDFMRSWCNEAKLVGLAGAKGYEPLDDDDY